MSTPAENIDFPAIPLRLTRLRRAIQKAIALSWRFTPVRNLTDSARTGVGRRQCLSPESV